MKAITARNNNIVIVHSLSRIKIPREGAAIAYVAELLSVPAIFIKAVTDIIDGEKPTAEEFLQNLVAVTANLDQAVTQAIYFINGRCLSDL
ncbi:hypothetical protein M5K25_001716 [Dendrobium thyrsiflorum]|uniref:Nucleoside phosphorylase domain-containing protein n=1 Tax=Dendrobium thyrsiflorum TaxID=117978 RepID=A0ABD0VR61_DENTH